MARLIVLSGSSLRSSPDGTPWESPHQVGPMFESASGAAVVLDMGNGRLMLVDTVGGLRTYASLRGSVFGGLSLPDGRMVILEKEDFDNLPLFIMASE